MRCVRIVCLCFTMSLAVGVSSASATPPEFYKLSAPNPPTPTVGFKGTGGVSTLQGGVVVECQAHTTAGKVHGSKAVEKVEIKYTGCKNPTITSTCQSSGVGKINTHKLKGELVDAAETPGGAVTPVLRLEPEIAGQTFATFKCSTLKVEIGGAVLAEPVPINVETHAGDVFLREKAAINSTCGQQQFLYVSGDGPCVSLFSGAGPSWLDSEEKFAYAGTKKLEIRA